MNNKKATLLLYANQIFDAKQNKTISGYVAILEDTIIAVGSRSEATQWIGPKTKILKLGNRTICPGFVDTHTFFLGYALQRIGINLEFQLNTDHLLSELYTYEKNLDSEFPLLGHNWQSNLFEEHSSETLDQAFPNRSVILFSSDHETCWMNTKAMLEYQFTPDTCYPEAYWRLIQVTIELGLVTEDQFIAYMRMLNTRGITSIKEMGFDDYYGFTDILKKLEDSQQMTLRVSFMSQPVSAGIDLEYGEAMRTLFQKDYIQFSGFNLMTDGSISMTCGDLKEPYASNPFIRCAQTIDYAKIETDVLAADQAGFRFSLHAQGDAAIQKSISIFEKCERNGNCLARRHAITDLEFSDPQDLERMGELGIVAEIYPQIMSFGSRTKTIPMIKKQLGSTRSEFYWNRRKMVDSNIFISCATDLPLLQPDIPEAIYHACGGFFPEGGQPFNAKNTMTIIELLKAWTVNGQYNLSRDHQLGSLEPGKLADIAILSDNIFKIPLNEIRNISVDLTITNGKIVYNNFEK